MTEQNGKLATTQIRCEHRLEDRKRDARLVP